ncbi:unnamed protein product [Cyclocybe aegerita]|uniref:Uncharacterized protein n=1 Tax=Cyclocybe aegerita TaxID=1973307 RepID=A0A8S0VXC2_CYCAE|nr:unnamed protein product [Cyclocybe aegerita]
MLAPPARNFHCRLATIGPAPGNFDLITLFILNTNHHPQPPSSLSPPVVRHNKRLKNQNCVLSQPKPLHHTEFLPPLNFVMATEHTAPSTPLTRASLERLTIAKLKLLAKNRGYRITKTRKSEIIDEIIEAAGAVKEEVVSPGKPLLQERPPRPRHISRNGRGKKPSSPTFGREPTLSPLAGKGTREASSPADAAPAVIAPNGNASSLSTPSHREEAIAATGPLSQRSSGSSSNPSSASPHSNSGSVEPNTRKPDLNNPSPQSSPEPEVGSPCPPEALEEIMEEARAERDEVKQRTEDNQRIIERLKKMLKEMEEFSQTKSDEEMKLERATEFAGLYTREGLAWEEDAIFGEHAAIVRKGTTEDGAVFVEEADALVEQQDPDIRKYKERQEVKNGKRKAVLVSEPSSTRIDQQHVAEAAADEKAQRKEEDMQEAIRRSLQDKHIFNPRAEGSKGGQFRRVRVVGAASQAASSLPMTSSAPWATTENDIPLLAAGSSKRPREEEEQETALGASGSIAGVENESDVRHAPKRRLSPSMASRYPGQPATTSDLIDPPYPLGTFVPPPPRPTAFYYDRSRDPRLKAQAAPQ